MDPQTKAFFNIEARGENAICFDCGQKEPQWASLSNGIYVCLECSGKHRSIGCHLSFVRCVWMDKWKPEQLAMMKAGGNRRLAEYLDEHGPKEWRKMPITSKYDIPACHNYRKLLKGWAATGDWAQGPALLQKAPAPTPAAPPKPSAFNLFDVVGDAENIVNALVSPSKPSPTDAEKPIKVVSATASEAQRILESMLKQGPAPGAPAPVTQAVPAAAAAPAVVKQAPAPQQQVQKAPAVDIWGDDLWDDEVEYDEI